MIRRSIGLLFVIAVVVVGAYDLWIYAKTQSHVRDVTYELAKWAGDNAAAQPRDTVAATLAQEAAVEGVTVTAYGQDAQGVEIYTQEEVKGTMVTAILVNLWQGVPYTQAAEEPLYVTDHRKAGFRQ